MTWRIRILCAVWLTIAGIVLPVRAGGTLTLSTDGMTVYDSTNNITWLANGNLASTNSFGLPACQIIESPTACINPSGSMNWVGATAWVAAMNAQAYLGHTDWQLPTTPIVDQPECSEIGPQDNSFGYNCKKGALGSLYYNGLGIVAPNSAVTVPPNQAGPFINFRPYFYWSQSPDGGLGYSVFSFDSGVQGGQTPHVFNYVLPMISGQIPGMPPPNGNGLQPSPDGQSVYDPGSNATWTANANLAALNSFGLPMCTIATGPALCVATDGSMTLDSANQFITNMNSYQGTGYLGQSNWQLPISLATCPTYGCEDMRNPMGMLYYLQFNLTAPTPIVPTVNLTAGPFFNLQPYYYWTCQADSIQDACEAEGPTDDSEWDFSFENGFLGTVRLEESFYVLPYFVGTRIATAPVMTWPTPANIAFGTALSREQLNAASNAAGTFVYTPPLGTVLPAGSNQTLSVQFTPTDTIDYLSAMQTVQINVTAASSPATLIDTYTLSRDPNTGNVLVTLTVANSGGSPATAVQLTSAKIGSTPPSTALPLALANVPAGGSSMVTLTFPPAAGTSGSRAVLAINGTFSGGSFGGSSRITLP